jgi:uncharacterized membrane protein
MIQKESSFHSFSKIFEILGVIVIFILLLAHSVRAEFSPITATMEISGKVIRPGDIVEFSITLQKSYNTSKSLTVGLSIDKKPDNWVAGFFADNNQVSHISFAEESIASNQILLRIRVPANTSNGPQLIRISLKPLGEDVSNYDIIYREFTVTVDRNAMPNLDIYAAIPGKKTHPGIPARFDVTLENKYDSRATAKISIISKPEMWGVDLLSSDDTRITELGISARGSQNFIVLVQPPENTSEDDYEVLIGASLEGGNQTISLPLKISINPDFDSSQALSAYIEMSSIVTGLEVRPENTAEFIMLLKNRFDQQMKLNLKAISKPAGWNVEFFSYSETIDKKTDNTGDKMRLTMFNLPPKSEQKFRIKVKPSSNASDGIYSVIVSAFSMDNRSISQGLEVTVNKGLENSQILGIYPGYSEINLNPGESTEIKVTLKNSGDEALKNVKLEVNEVSGLSSEVKSFQTIEKLEAGESKIIPVEIKARADADAGLKEIFMRAKSDDILSEEKSIKVKVEKSGSSGIFGIAMVGLTFVALIFIIRKFGRR